DSTIPSFPCTQTTPPAMHTLSLHDALPISLAGQPVFFTHWQLIKFRDGRRKDPMMSPVAANLSDADMADLAAYYATLPPRPRPQTLDAAKAAAGQRLAVSHHCTSCHRPDLGGQHQVPRLAGQDLDYLLR